jgi:peroxiredoxin Q/BCP
MNTIILGAHDQAPDFTGTAVGAEFGDGMPMRLSDYFDSQIVLYFYPQDHTPGCTAQACKLRDAWEEFGGRAALFGVSADSPETHRQFIDVHSLPFPLISDSDQRIVRAYGVWLDAAEGGTGAKYHTERTTFIIAPGGTIKSVLRKVDPYQHDRLLLEMLYS